MGHSEYDPAAKERRPWNAGRMVGAKRGLKPHQVWAIHRLVADPVRVLTPPLPLDLAVIAARCLTDPQKRAAFEKWRAVRQPF